MQIEALKSVKYKNSQQKKNSDENLNKTLKGVLINNHVNTSVGKNISFDEIQDSLLIVDKPKYYSIPKEEQKNEEESSFNVNKAIKPLLIGSAVILLGCAGLSSILKHSSNNLLKSKSFEQLPDLAVNMNIKEEPQFAIYRAIRDPNFKNIIGAAAIFLMSGITIACKNFVDGIKEIWLKKQSADIEKNLQENLIEVETNSFSGKLKVVNDIMSQNVKYFDDVLNNTKEKENTPNIFTKFLSFKGESKNNKESNNKESNNKEQLNKNLKYIALISTTLIAGFALGKISLSNLRKTAENTNTFANIFTERTINAIQKTSEKTDKKDIPQIIELLKSICAKPEFINEIGKKYNLSEKEIQAIIDSVKESKKTIFADAPTALGGIPKKIQYYCYIDENRGHLYNWILNPENKFTKYIFLAFTMSGAIGYLFKQGMDAIKEATVMKENAKTELNLRKRLVDVEIRNFKSKKESAIQPLIDNFYKQASNGTKSKEELKQIADNILTEIKNGPPYVYT